MRELVTRIRRAKAKRAGGRALPTRWNFPADGCHPGAGPRVATSITQDDNGDRRLACGSVMAHSRQNRYSFPSSKDCGKKPERTHCDAWFDSTDLVW